MTTKMRVLFLFVLLTIVRSASGATLDGVVSDSAGNPLRGAAVTLIRGDARATNTTDGNGRFRFPSVEPGGDYRVEVTRDGFAAARVAPVTVELGVGAALRVELQPRFEQTVEVIAQNARAVPTDITTSMNLTAAEIEALPSRRDFQLLSTLSPGVRLDRSTDSPAINGATHKENDYVIEGLSTRDTLEGDSATNLLMSFVGELQVIRGALPAEYGRALGGVLNVVTKSGSNDFTGEVSALLEDGGWGENAVVERYQSSATEFIARDKKDIALSLGGPLVRDHVWFFGAYDARRDERPRHLTDAAYDIDRSVTIQENQDLYAARLNAQFAARHTLSLSMFGDPGSTYGWLGGPRWDADVAKLSQRGGSRNAVLRYDTVLSPNITTELLAGSHTQKIFDRPLTEHGRTVPLQSDNRNGFRYGGWAQTGRDDSKRATISARGAFTTSAFEVRSGAELERNRYESDQALTVYVLRPKQNAGAAGFRDILIEATNDFSGYGTNDIASAWLQTRLQLTRKVSFDGGVRWEQQRLDSGRGATVADGRLPDGRIHSRAVDHFTFAGNWAPRLALSWDPSARGRTRVTAFAGRYFEAVPLWMNVNTMNGYFSRQRFFYHASPEAPEDWYNRNGSPLNESWTLYRTVSGNTPSDPVPFDPSTRLQYEDEYSINASHQLGEWTLGSRLVQRSIGRVVDNQYVLGGADPYWPGLGFIVTNPGEGKYSHDISRPRRDYRALELTARRRLTQRWQAFASFLTSQERGNYDGTYNYAFPIAGPNNTPDIDTPGLARNATGKLRADRPYEIKVNSSVEAFEGVTLAQALTYSAGIPISRMAAASSTYSQQGLYLTPRGDAGRTPDVWSLDLHAAWRLPLTVGSATATISLDVFNATNNHGVLEVEEQYFAYGTPGYDEWVDEDNLDEWYFPKWRPDLPASPWYKTPTLYQNPRAVQLQLRVRM